MTSALSSRTALASKYRLKSSDTSLTGRYISALFYSMHDDIKIDPKKIRDEFLTLRNVFTNVHAFRSACSMRIISAADQKVACSVVSDSFQLSNLTRSFLDTLAENRRLGILDKMVTKFEEVYRSENNQILCKITSSTPLSKDYREKVESSVNARVKTDYPGMDTVMEYCVNPQIIGGLIVHIKDRIIDYSVQSMINLVQKELRANQMSVNE